jgi:hypothetical protein
MEPAVTTSSPRSALAAGNINGIDRIVVELLSPPDMPQVDHDPLAAEFHGGCAYKLSKHRERDCAVVRSGEHRVDSDQGTATLTPTSSGIERSDLDRSTYGSRIKVSGCEPSIGLSVSLRGLLARALQPTSPIPATG